MWLSGVVYAKHSTQSRLSASGRVPNSTFEWQFVLCFNLFAAMVASADVVILLRLDRTIAGKYMATTWAPARDSLLATHERLRKVAIGGSVAGFTLAGLYGSAALYGTTFESYTAVDALFIPLWLTLSYVNFFLLSIIGILICSEL